jgi:hypothetical protein
VRVPGVIKSWLGSANPYEGAEPIADVACHEDGKGGLVFEGPLRPDAGPRLPPPVLPEAEFHSGPVYRCSECGQWARPLLGVEMGHLPKCSRRDA